MAMAADAKTKDTELVRWNPWADLPAFENRLAQPFNNFWPAGLSSTEGFVPGGDLTESDDAYTLEVDLPGVDKKDISIDVNQRRVSVSGTRTERDRNGVLRRTTRTTGSFVYEITLPTPVEEKRATASMRDGVLRIELPKAENAKGTRVEIK
jgi:HSP20 family protein